MLLPIYHHHSPLSCKTYVVSSPSFFPSLSPKIQFLQNPKPSKFLLRSSTVDTETVSKTAIQRIAEKLRSLGYIEENAKENQQPETGHGSAGEIFLPSPEHLAKQRVGYTIDSSWSTPENPVPEPGSGTTLARFYELKGEVDKQKRSAKKEDRTPSLAELRIPVTELKRLRGIGISLKKKLKVGKAGVTEGIVNGIHERWRRSELVKIQCEDLCKLNMKRTHDILERKTGGLVIWRSGSTIILYRGDNYVYPYFLADSNTTTDTSHDNMSLESSYIVDGERIINSLSTVDLKSAVPSPPNEVARSSLIHGVGSPNKVRFQLPGEAQLAEEADLLLDGMGPRFTDWWGYDPLPVDADLLPAIVPGYRKPFRLLPYGVKPILTNDEMTTLKRLGRPLPCHFALGRNRNLQGLAVSMVKLWEKCEIAKIAVKRGVQNTNSEMMAEEIKRLTGGTLLSRDREFIVFYRGKDFLPPAVSTAIEERRKHGKQKPEVLVHATPEPDRGTTQQDFLDELKETAGGKRSNIISEQKKPRSTKLAIESISTKLSVALEKKDKAEKLLAELETAREPPKHEVDKEGITEEERYMLRKVGLRMKPFLLMGRRGVFDGTVENMHLHWKYRELVKIICNDRCIEDVHRAARTLESESGGILVAVERVNMGYAIIIYRGKNYQRPVNLRPQTLLNKREAMKRSLEAQRRESLKLHVLKLTKNIDQLKLKLENGNIQLNCVQSAEYESSGDSSSTVESAHSQENVEAVEDHGVSMISSDDMLDGSSDDDEITKQDNLTDSFSTYDYDAAQTKVESSSSKAVLEEANSKTFLDVLGDKADSDSTFCSEISLSQAGIAVDKADHYRSKNDVRRTSVESAKNQTAVSHQRHLKKGPVGLHFRAAPLSNKDRLLLRKQALKMRKRPVLAVGRNNVITGVAKTIKTHFKKHPLAIVNVKGRAEGTSIQEVVFKLEQATGAVLVSQEPNKVILYRGWGEEEEEEHGGIKNDKTNGRRTENRERESQKLVSPQLMEAIRLECGLQSSHEKR